MSSHAKRATELFEQGCNCSQAVFAAFCDETGLDFETALKLASSLGGGMGGLREVCGAVSGMFLVAGLKYGYSDPNDPVKKAEHYKRIRALATQFKEQHDSIICRELLELQSKQNRSADCGNKRPCTALVEYAANLLDESIKPNNMEEQK